MRQIVPGEESLRSKTTILSFLTLHAEPPIRCICGCRDAASAAHPSTSASNGLRFKM